MPKRSKFFAGPWNLTADPPPCDPGNPSRALAYCEKARREERCTCTFDLSAIAADLEELGLGEYVEEFEDAIDSDSLADLTSELLKQLRSKPGLAAERLREEVHLLHSLANEGSGVKPIDDS